MSNSNQVETDKVIDLFVPGRLCLFGEHSDWAGRFRDINSEIETGQAIVTGIDLGLYATAKKSQIFEISSIDDDGNVVKYSCDMDKAILEEEAKKSIFFCYACGVAAYVMENYRVGGISIEIYKSTLPIKKGLSSSAAICVLVARAFNELYHLHVSTNGEMQIAFRGELLTSSRCGRLDQACAYGVRPVCMEFDGENISVEKLKVGKELYWVFADLNASKDTKKILTDLNKCFPFPESEIDRNVVSALGPENHKMISKVKEAIEEGDAEKIGQLMTEAQDLFDNKVAPACMSQLESPVLHKTLKDKRVKELSYGGKGVGSQGDGTVQFITKDKKNQAELVNYLNNELGMQAYPFTLPTHNRIRKAIIPIAGFATRMYPASRFIKKAFFPVVDSNGIAKPVIMYLLEELDNEGIEEIYLIVGEGEEDEYRSIFQQTLSEEHINKLPKALKDYERVINRIGNKLKFVVQKEKRGFGHAVAQVAPYIEKDEPILLLLGDFIYKSNISYSCTRQTINAYTKSGGQTVVSVKEIPLEDVVHYGTIAGDFSDKRDYIIHVSEMKEKPTVDYAKDYLGIEKQGETKYYATFGQYVLTSKVFEYLLNDIKEHDEKENPSEIELTAALQKVCEENGMSAVLVDGESYDVGIPSKYLETSRLFSV